MPLDLRLNPSRDLYAAPWRDADPTPPLPLPPPLPAPTGLPASVERPDTPWYLMPVHEAGAAEVPVLNAAVDLLPVPPLAMVNQFAAVLPDAETLVVPIGACLRGHFSAPCVHVKGTVHGSITATRGPLVVEAGAAVLGTVDSAGALVIAGQVRSPGRAPAVVARGSLQLASTARVSGEVRYVDVAIYDGARVAGTMLPLTH